MPLIFFEDPHVARFYPVALTRPLDDIRFGIVTIREKWLRVLGENTFTRLLRPWLAGVFSNPAPEPDTEWIWVNARFVPGSAISQEVAALKTGEGIAFHGVPVVVKMDGAQTLALFNVQESFAAGFWESFEVRHTPEDPIRYQHLDPDFADVSLSETQAGMLLDHAWDLTHYNASEIIRDAAFLNREKNADKISDRRFLCSNPKNIFVGEGAVVDVGAILDASDGPSSSEPTHE